MRYASLSIIPLAAGLALIVAATAAHAAQDTPMTANGVTAVCTGVGSSKDNPDWAAYPVKIVLANSAGEDLAAAHITVAKAGKTMLETDCDAPWVLLKAPTGKYTATATIAGRPAVSTSFSTSMGAKQQELTITFPSRQQASAQ